MKLFYLPGACSMVPHTALQWIGQPYEAEAVTHAQTKEPAYLAMNPQGAVPLLVDGDLVLSQNVAILAYLDARFPEARLFGSDTIEGKARAWRWLAFLNADVHKAFGQLFRTPPWAEDETVKNAMQQAARAQIAGMLKQADDQLANHAWLGGEEISVADIYLYVILRWANGLSVDLSQMKHLNEVPETRGRRPRRARDLRPGGIAAVMAVPSRRAG